MSLKREEWDTSYKNKDNFIFYPHEEIIRFSAKYIAKRVGIGEVNYIKSKNCKGLDLGCGIGRHIMFFEKLGITTYGVDLSIEAIEVAKSWLKKEKVNFENKLFAGSAENLPWANNSFEFIISHGVLDSMPFEIARNIVKECHRVTDIDGLFYCDLIGEDEAFNNGFAKEVVVKAKHEEGTIQSYFTIEKINELFNGYFEILEIKNITSENLTLNNYNTRYHLVLKKI